MRMGIFLEEMQIGASRNIALQCGIKTADYMVLKKAHSWGDIWR
jgi:hypothetical protein